MMMTSARIPRIESPAPGVHRRGGAGPTPRRSHRINDVARNLERLHLAAEGEQILRSFLKGTSMEALRVRTGLSQRTLWRRIETFSEVMPVRHQAVITGYQSLLMRLIVDDLLYWRLKARGAYDHFAAGGAEPSDGADHRARQMIALSAYRSAMATAVKVLELQPRGRKGSR